MMIIMNKLVMEIFKYVETYYNAKRIHYTLVRLTPNQIYLQNCQND